MSKLLNQILCGDCIEILSKVEDPFADLIFADPPFNIGYKYDRYDDKVDPLAYRKWTLEWMRACCGVLKPHGSFYVAIGDEHAVDVKLAADELGLTMRNWIIWHYSFGQQMKNKFARSHAHILYFVRDPKHFTFNDHTVRIPSDRQLIYNDRRANPIGKMPDDVWSGFPRVCGTFRERQGWHPCQMPEGLLRRIIAVSSNEGDCVLDPFSGSGTTPAVACQMGRRYVGIDVSNEYVENARERIAELSESHTGNLFLADHEVKELQRLLRDMEMSPQQVASDEKLLRLATNQLAVRMNHDGSYREDQIATVLEGLGG